MSEALKKTVLEKLKELESSPESMTSKRGLYSQLIQAVDEVVVDQLLMEFRGNQTQAAEHLGINRATFRQKLKAKKLRKHGFFR